MAANRCRTASTALSLCACFFSTIALAIPGQPGTLDASWATLSPLGAGKVMTAVGTGQAFATAAALQADGKVVLAGRCSASVTTLDFCALRHQANGTLDTSFNGTGSVVTAVGAAADQATAVVVQPDGKVVLAGYCYNGMNDDFCAVRYNANGTLDSTFGSGGKVITPIGASDDRAAALILQPDGKLVVAGFCWAGATGWDFCAIRYSASGTLDTSFNGTGSVITPISASSDLVTAAALQSDGKLVLAGYCYNGTNNDFCALRYNGNGTPDLSFNGTGKVTTAVGSGADLANALAIQPDGKLVLAGQCKNGSTDGFCAVRYNANGSLDTSFNGTGKIITAIDAGNDSATAVTVLPDGKLVLAGACATGIVSAFCALRYHANGALDANFNSGGTVVTPVGSSYDSALAMVQQPDGKIVLTGNCFNTTSNNYNFCAARYDGGPFGYQNCKPDLDGDGLMTATVDGLIYMRVMLGLTGSAVVGGVTFPANATRNTWPLIRDYLVTQCGMSLP